MNKHHEHAKWVIEQVSSVNPHRRQEQNNANEFSVYNTGFLAGYLASLMREDPYIERRFLKHVDGIRNRKRTSQNG